MCQNFQFTHQSGLYWQVKYEPVATKMWPLALHYRVVSELRSNIQEKLLVHWNCGLKWEAVSELRWSLRQVLLYCKLLADLGGGTSLSYFHFSEESPCLTMAPLPTGSPGSTSGNLSVQFMHFMCLQCRFTYTKKMTSFYLYHWFSIKFYFMSVNYTVRFENLLHCICNIACYSVIHMKHNNHTSAITKTGFQSNFAIVCMMA